MLCMVMASSPLHAQKFLWNVNFNSQFDNREYKNTDLEISGTYFGARLTPSVGLGWGRNNGNALMIGVDLMADFGAKTFYTDPDLLFYYQYDSKRFKAYAGVFPRSKMIGEYSKAFFSDSVRFYDSNLEGLLLQYAGDHGYVEFGCDWNSMYSAERREKFMIFAAAQIRAKVAYAGISFDMYHHAGSYTLTGVVDNVLIEPYVGVNLASVLPLDLLYVQAGWLQGFQNDRSYVGEYVRPGGVNIDAGIQKWGFGIRNTLYLGDDMMPYYDALREDGDADAGTEGTVAYGHHLYNGEAFYRTYRGVYDRLEFYWEPFAREDMRLRVASVHHYDGRKWAWQQKITFTVNINARQFAGKHKQR